MKFYYSFDFYFQPFKNGKEKKKNLPELMGHTKPSNHPDSALGL